MRFAPNNQELRRQLRAIASLPSVREAAITVLANQVRSALCDEPVVAAALLEVLVRGYELLDRPVEAVAAMEQLVALAPDHVEHLLGLASRCENLGAWAKAAESFERVGAVGTKEQACAALRAAAKLYRENSQLERAVEAYRAIIAHRAADKEAWRSLEELLEQLSRWRELADVRGELAKRAPSAAEKARKLRAQAHAFEQAGDGTAAADAMANAARYMPDDISGLLDYADILVRTGQGREAAELLSKRVHEAIARRASIDEITALRARHAEVLEDECGDRAAAAIVLEQLLAEHPTYVPALERVVWHASNDPDPRVHAAALERYAAVIEEPAGRAAMFVEASRRYRQASDVHHAARCLQQAIDLTPDVAFLHDELEEVRASINLRRASTDASAGDVTAAERRLREMLAVRPHDVEANLALAELLVAANDLDAAREHLHDTLANAPDTIPKPRLAPLAHKYALVVDASGDREEAHRLLHEAHLLDRHSLLITLDLGQSCIARKLWRQAILYLAPLAEHPDAGRHAVRVAEGLVQAGQAEVRALRPASAMKHYEAAIGVDPKCPSAWHALAADAMERGDLKRAIECFEREATATTNPSDRDRLFDALGDLARDVLDDPSRAESYWSKVGDASVAVLRKLLAVQRDRHADIDRAETCLRLAALDRTQDKELTEEAAEIFAAAGDFVRARAAAERLIALHPLDVDAVSCASEVVLAACDADAAATWLHRALEAWAANKSSEPRQAELWRRLGDAERSRNRNAEAKAAYERAIAIGFDSPDAIAARRALIELTPKTARTIEALEVLVEADQLPADVIALARAFVAADRVDDARAVFDLARACGIQLASEDEQFIAQTAPRATAYDEQVYGSTLDDNTRRETIDDPQDPPLGAVLEMLGEVLSLVAPDPTSALRGAGITDASRISMTSYSAVAAQYPHISKALAGPTTLLFTSGGMPEDIRILLSSPPVVVLGSEIASICGVDVTASIDAMLRFKLGRAVELARPHRLFATGTEPDAFRRLVGGLWVACAANRDNSIDPALADEAKRLHSLLPMTLRRRIGEVFATKPREAFDADRYITSCHRAADRSGMLACGNVAIATAAGPSDATAVVRFAASRRYRLARRRLRVRAR
ncbi:MAG TPA: tetratricopeptide repeat protein [Kofleriaceae bacterium]